MGESYVGEKKAQLVSAQKPWQAWSRHCFSRWDRYDLVEGVVGWTEVLGSTRPEDTDCLTKGNDLKVVRNGVSAWNYQHTDVSDTQSRSQARPYYHSPPLLLH